MVVSSLSSLLIESSSEWLMVGRASALHGGRRWGRDLPDRDEGAVVDDPAVVEFYDAVGEMVIAVVVADDDDGLAAAPQLGQEPVVEDLLEVRVLVGGPLVEEVDGAVFEVGREQGEALALPLR